MVEPETSSIRIEVLPATLEQKPILANLLQLYIHDFSELIDLRIGADGRFGYDRLPLYWSEPNRFPFLVRVNDALAGFALVQQGSRVSGDHGVWDMEEFFVLRGYRRHRVGMRVAENIWRLFTGRWEVRVTEKNLAARAFWKRAVSEFTGVGAESALTEVAGQTFYVFSFVSRPLSSNS